MRSQRTAFLASWNGTASRRLATGLSSKAAFRFAAADKARPHAQAGGEASLSLAASSRPLRRPRPLRSVAGQRRRSRGKRKRKLCRPMPSVERSLEKLRRAALCRTAQSFWLKPSQRPAFARKPPRGSRAWASSRLSTCRPFRRARARPGVRERGYRPPGFRSSAPSRRRSRRFAARSGPPSSGR